MNAQMLKITDTDIADRAVKDGWRVSALANSCGVSVPTLERCFHETKGQSPREWMTAERMRRARLLLERGERIKDIAGLLCYGHQRNFATAFTAFHGYPPREHRLGKWLVNGGRTPSPKVQSPKSKVQSPKSPIMLCTKSGNDNGKFKFNVSNLPVGESFLDRLLSSVRMPG